MSPPRVFGLRQTGSVRPLLWVSPHRLLRDAGHGQKARCHLRCRLGILSRPRS
jgi:hypothetical protein